MFERISGDRDTSRVVVALRRRWWVIVLLAVIAAVGAYVLAGRKPDMYTASSALLFQDSQLDQKLFGNQVISSTDPSREAATNQSLVDLPSVAQLVASDLNIPVSRVRSEVSVGSDSQSDVLTIAATDASPTFAARLANAYVTEFIEFRRRADQSQLSAAQQLVSTQLAKIPAFQQNSATAQNLQKTKTELQLLASLQTGNALPVQVARPPSSPSAPTPSRDAIIGAILGLLVGCGLVFLLERRDRRLKTMPEIEALYDVPIIGTVPQSNTLRVAGAAGSPREQDAFRMIRAQLRYFDVDRDIKRVMVTSADSGEGKSLVSLNLARAAGSADNQRTLLIEADLRRPSLAARLELNGMAGLAELLSQSRDLESGLRELVVTPEPADGDRASSGFDMLLAGATPPNPVELMDSQRMAELMELVASIYDVVIIDTPPIGVVSDPIPLVHQVDGVLVIARLGRSRRDHAVALMKQLSGLGAHVLGVVVNSFQPSGGSYPDYFGYAPSERDKGARPWRRPASRPATRIK
jgi:polysaccharide biosynthesis transport protein